MTNSYDKRMFTFLLMLPSQLQTLFTMLFCQLNSLTFHILVVCILVATTKKLRCSYWSHNAETPNMVTSHKHQTKHKYMILV
jgi:hypothetical protein